MKTAIIVKVLETIVSNPDVLKKFSSMPNIPFWTMGGHVWWNDLANVNGWRVQQNQLTHHVRILDPDDIRHAWGTEEAMMELFDKIVKY